MNIINLVNILSLKNIKYRLVIKKKYKDKVFDKVKRKNQIIVFTFTQ